MGHSDDHRVALSGSAPNRPPAKTERLNGPPSTLGGEGSKKRPIDLTADEEGVDRPQKSIKQSTPRKANAEEKRLRAFRKQPPRSYLERLDRALSQRMFVIDRQRQDTEEGPEEVIELAGSTGNIYTVKINKMPSCNCPDSVKGNQCKHVIYVVVNVLKAPAHLRYQLAYLSTEMREIFNNAPSPSSLKIFGRNKNLNRKPLDGECPICFTDFDPVVDHIVWCKSSCGQNVHKECFQQWAKSQFGKQLRCIYCRAHWKCDDETLQMLQQLLAKRKEMAANQQGHANQQGYVNLAPQLGISTERDNSSYHQPWVVRNGRSVQYNY